MSNINLIGIEFSKKHFYSRETVYIKCTFQALCNQPIDCSVKLFADFKFGHMNIAAADTTNYSRTIADMYPQPMCYKKGDVWSSSIRWNVPAEQYPGTLEVSIGLIDDNMEYVSFNVDEKTYNRFYAGDINVAFPGAGKEWIQKHSEPIIYTYRKDDIKQAESDIEFFDSIICWRNIKDDTEEECYAAIKLDDTFENEAVKFSFKYKNKTYYIDDIEEKNGFEFLNIKIPTMFMMKNGKMVSMFGEGRLINSKTSYPWGYEQKYYVRNVGILTDENKSILIETPYIDDRIHYSVCEKDGEKFSALGVTFTYRLRAFGNMESIKVINKPTVKIESIKGNWQKCIPMLRSGIKKRTDAYDRCIFYYYSICSGPGEHVNTFKQALDYIKQVYYVTGGIKQFMILCGWQHEGHDTGYPDVFKLKDGAGTLEELRDCISEAKKYNACMTFHDNYDDMYEDNGYFEADCAAINSKGEYMTSWIWVGGVSTIMSLPKYCKTGKMQERVKKTVNMLGIDESYHIDVLSCEARRYDYDPQIKMAAQEVVEYKKAVVKEFEKYGVVVTSEAISHAFAGVIGFAWRMTESKFKLFSDEIYIPMTAMIYHGIVPYAGEGTFGLINGAVMTIPSWIDIEESKEDIFLKTIPIGMLCNQNIEDYEIDGYIHKIIYSDGKIIYDEENDDITVVCNGSILTQAGNSFVKGFKEKQYIGFTKHGDFSVKNLNKGKIQAVYELESTGAKQSIRYICNEDKIRIFAAPKTAFLVEFS